MNACRIGWAALVAALPVALWAGPALAHLDIQPRVVEQGRATDLAIELPLLRPGPPPTKLDIRGRGVTLQLSRLRATLGDETRWDVRLTVDAPPGNATLTLLASFDDGSTVETEQRLTVVPAAVAAPFPWARAVAGAVAAIGLGVVLLWAIRRAG